jgi:hypothetical protein
LQRAHRPALEAAGLREYAARFFGAVPGSLSRCARQNAVIQHTRYCVGDFAGERGDRAPIVEGHVGCIVIRPDGSRVLARAVPDPLAE